MHLISISSMRSGYVRNLAEIVRTLKPLAGVLDNTCLSCVELKRLKAALSKAHRTVRFTRFPDSDLPACKFQADSYVSRVEYR